MSGSRVPIANQIDQHLLDSNPTILDHVNDSFDLDYDAITLPFTKPSWKARWQRYCVSNENDVKKGRARASYIAGKSENVVQDRQTAKEAEVWRLTRVYDKNEVNVSKLDECESIVAFASDWLELDSPDEGIRFDSEIALKQEVAYASYLSLHTLILPAPRNRKYVADYARSVMAALDSTTYLQLSVMIPVSDPTELDKGASPALSEFKGDPSSTWEIWDAIRTLCDYSPRLGLALDLGQPLPPPCALKRWSSEPTRQIIIPANAFIGNVKGYPVLSKPCQEFIKEQMKTLPTIVLTETYEGIHKSGGSKAYVQYLRYMEKLSNDSATSVEQFASGYMDWLQAPLQPLLDNLDSTTYEIFEKDPVKYQKYEQATYLALLDKEPNSLTKIAVVGAGRGPLVQGAINAVEAAGEGRKIHIMAVEKNPNACVTLQSRMDEWNESKIATVELVFGDMRIIELEDEQKNDILISELLGSFGDNELSPECLDGAMRLLKPYGVCIPSYYTSYIAPLSSSKLYNEVMHMGDAKSAEMPYVVMFQAVNILSGMNKEDDRKPIQQCWSYKHPSKYEFVMDRNGNPMSNYHNTRAAHLTFSIPYAGVLHGLAGYFEAHLYGNVWLSTHPERYDQEMLSWFPIYFPINMGVYLPTNSEVDVHLWRLTDNKKVWFEWSVEVFIKVDGNRIKINQSKLHNHDAKYNRIEL